MKSDLVKIKMVLDQLDNNFDRANYIMDLGKGESRASPPNDAVLVPKCTSSVSIWAAKDRDKWMFFSKSQGLFSGGIAQLVVRTATGHTTEELEDFGFDWFKDLGIENFVTDGRLSGFENMLGIVCDLSKR
jgi:hypothetical protein